MRRWRRHKDTASRLPIGRYCRMSLEHCSNIASNQLYTNQRIARCYIQTGTEPQNAKYPSSHRSVAWFRRTARNLERKSRHNHRHCTRTRTLCFDPNHRPNTSSRRRRRRRLQRLACKREAKTRRVRSRPLWHPSRHRQARSESHRRNAPPRRRVPPQRKSAPCLSHPRRALFRPV